MVAIFYELSHFNMINRTFSRSRYCQRPSIRILMRWGFWSSPSFHLIDDLLPIWGCSIPRANIRMIVRDILVRRQPPLRSIQRRVASNGEIWISACIKESSDTLQYVRLVAWFAQRCCVFRVISLLPERSLGWRACTTCCSKCHKELTHYPTDEKKKDGHAKWRYDCSGNDYESWVPRTAAEVKHLGEEYLKCKNNNQREIFVKQFVRYSVLSKLPYFDAVTMTVIDPLHNLYLGVTKFLIDSWKTNGILTTANMKLLEQRINSLSVSKRYGRMRSKLGSMSGLAKRYKSLLLFIPDGLWKVSFLMIISSCGSFGLRRSRFLAVQWSVTLTW